jgi:Leucine-rich repeat (LRR) protein
MLTRLNLGANPISSLPETLSECAALEFLGLARTQISCLPEWVFSIQQAARTRYQLHRRPDSASTDRAPAGTVRIVNYTARLGHPMSVDTDSPPSVPAGRFAGASFF